MRNGLGLAELKLRRHAIAIRDPVRGLGSDGEGCLALLQVTRHSQQVEIKGATRVRRGERSS